MVEEEMEQGEAAMALVQGQALKPWEGWVGKEQKGRGAEMVPQEASRAAGHPGWQHC